MKIEMGESIVGSWLKHVCECQIVEQNWKPSKNIGNFIKFNEVENIFKDIRKTYKGLEVEFVSKKVNKLNGFIVQGEIDVLGISLIMDENNSLKINKFFAVDVAFHENGLNYSGKNKERMLKKYIRTALTLYLYFGIDTGEIIFITPYVKEKHKKELQDLSIDLKEIFKKHNINYEFKLYCNEDFYEKVYYELYKLKDEISNTSELFMRSLKLIELTKRFESKIPQKIEIKQNNEGKVSELKIGATVVRDFKILSNENKISEKEISNLCDSNYSKETFGIPYPVLVEYSDIEENAFINNIRRYYTSVYKFNDKKYLLCNHWTEGNRKKYNEWLKQFEN